MSQGAPEPPGVIEGSSDLSDGERELLRELRAEEEASRPGQGAGQPLEPFPGAGDGYRATERELRWLGTRVVSLGVVESVVGSLALVSARGEREEGAEGGAGAGTAGYGSTAEEARHPACAEARDAAGAALEEPEVSARPEALKAAEGPIALETPESLPGGGVSSITTPAAPTGLPALPFRVYSSGVVTGDPRGSWVSGVISDLWGTLDAPRYTVHLVGAAPGGEEGQSSSGGPNGPAARNTRRLARGDLVYLFTGSAEGFGELDDGSALARAEADAVAGVGAGDGEQM